MRQSSLAALILLCTSVPTLSAQSDEAGTSPMRIRLIPSDASWKPMTGTLVSVGSDTIQFVRDGIDLERIDIEPPIGGVLSA